MPGGEFAGSNRYWHLALASVVLLALALRLSALDFAPFKLDEADALSRASALVEGRGLAADGGLMSWGLPDPPLMIYVLAVPALVSRDPALAAAWLGLLDTVAVAITGLLAAEWFGRRAGLGAALLYATAPWAVFYARDTWVDVLPLLTAVALYAASRVVVRRQAGWAVGFFAALGLQEQTHLLAVVYLPAALASIAAFPRRWCSWALAVGAALAVAVNAPYLLSQVGARPERFFSTVGEQVLARTPSGSPLDMLEMATWAVSGNHLQWLLGESGDSFADVSGLLAVAQVVVLALLALGLANALLGLRPGRAGRSQRALLLFWALGPIAVLALPGPELHLHYFLTAFPAAFILAALGLETLARPIPRLRLGLGGLAAAQVAAMLALTVHLPQVEMGGGLGLPAGTWRGLAGTAAALTSQSGTPDLYVMAGTSDPAHVDQTAALSYVLAPHVRPRFVRDEAVVFPVGAPAVFLRTADTTATPVLSRLADEVTQVDFPGGQRAARFYRMSARSPEAVAALPSRPVEADLDNGLRFLGFDAPARLPGSYRLELTAYWWLRDVGDGERADDLAFFYQILDQRGTLVAQKDGMGLPSRDWRSGDVLIERRTIPVSTSVKPGPYRLIAGVYSRRDGKRARLMASDADSVQLGAVQVGTGPIEKSADRPPDSRET